MLNGSCVCYRAGNEAFQLRKIDKALRHYTQAIAAWKKLPPAQCNRKALCACVCNRAICELKLGTSSTVNMEAPPTSSEGVKAPGGGRE